MLGLGLAQMLIACPDGCRLLMWTRVELACPEQTMTPDQIEALYHKGLAATKRDMMGEHHRLDALAEGLPILKEAALQGHTGAMDAYNGHLIQAGIIDMTSGPFWWRSQLDVAEEGMMWLILRAHLGSPITEGDKATFRVLLDPNIPFPEGFFRSSSGTAWMLQMVTPSGLERARKQAYAWRKCWP